MKSRIQNKVKNSAAAAGGTGQYVHSANGFWRIKYLLIFLVLFLANICFASRLLLLKEYANLIFLCYPAESVTESSFEQFKENEGSKNFSKMALWKSEEEITVSAENTGREQKVSFYQVKGQPDAVFGNHLLLGRYFTEEEHRVCLLDQGLARRLFGSENVLGMEVEIGQKSYRITGILKGENQIFAAPAEENTGFDGVAVRKQEKEQSSALAVSLIEAIFGRTDGQKVDGQLYFMTAVLFYSMMSALMLVILGIVVIRGGKTEAIATAGEGKTETAAAEGRKKRTLMAEKGIILCWILSAACMAAAACILISGIKNAAPGADYLPAYWSDFDFFVRLFQEKAGQIQRLAAYQELPVWREMLRAWQQVIGGEIIAGLLFYTAVHRLCP